MDFISLDRMFGLNQSGRREFWEIFTMGGMVKIKRDQNQLKPKTKKKVSFLKTKNTKNLECHSTYPLRENVVPEISADP